MTKKELSLKLFNYFESHSNDRYELTDFYDYIDALEYDENTDTYTVNKETALNWYVKDISNYDDSSVVATLTYDFDMMDDDDTDERNEIEQLLNDIKNVED